MPTTDDLISQISALMEGKDNDDGDVPMPSLAEVLYSDPNPDGSRKNCKNCVMMASQTNECYIFDPEFKVKPDWVCGYHVYGEQMREFRYRLPIHPAIPEKSGYVEAKEGSSCDLCKYYDKIDQDSGKCAAVYESGKPATVAALGCCTRWVMK